MASHWTLDRVGCQLGWTTSTPVVPLLNMLNPLFNLLLVAFYLFSQLTTILALLAWIRGFRTAWLGRGATKTWLLYTRYDHVFMVQSRDQWLESSGTALASGYHNFVQIKAPWKKKWVLADIRNPDGGLRKRVAVLHLTASQCCIQRVCGTTWI